jgi:hypothetical protein|tara:strand:- start:30 stop:257 length:228 start_codon:yes stop_codon:yes gene_type:complete
MPIVTTPTKTIQEGVMTKKTIVVTGACGYVAQRMWPELSERYHLVARRVIGYQPQDNSQVNFADRIANIAREGSE